MELNELRAHYCYPRIDSWLLFALYANKFNQGKSRASIIREYDAVNLNKYASIGQSVTSNDRCANSDILLCTKDAYRMLTSVISLNDDIKFLEIAIRFLFDKETCKRFVGRRLLKAYKYGYNVIHACKPLFYPLMIEDIFIELDDDQALTYLRSFPHWREDKFVIASILSAKHNKELVIEDAKSFCKTFINIYENGISVEALDIIRRSIDDANEAAREIRGYESREDKRIRHEAELIRREKTRIAAEEKAKEEKIRQEEDRAIKNLMNDLNRKSSKIILNTVPPKFNDNDCINAIIVGAWVYWLSTICHISDEAIQHTVSMPNWGIKNSNILTTMRLKVAQKKDNKPMIPLAIDKDKYIDIEWKTAMVADYCILENVYRSGMPIDQFVYGDAKATREISMKAMIPEYMVSATQSALRCYCTNPFAEFLADKILDIVSKDPISIKYYTFEEAKVIWKEKKNTTADASST